MGQNNNHKSNFHFLILGCKSFAVNYSLKSQIKADSLQLKHILFVSFEIHCGGV